MKLLSAIGSALAITGCASAPPAIPGDSFLGGESGDLRVLFDDACPQARPSAAVPDRSSPNKGFEDFAELPGLAINMLANIGGITFKSFGSYLKQAGHEDVTRSVGANGGLFYSSPSNGRDVSINPDLRCMYIVRDGFAPSTAQFDSKTSADLRQTWERLGLTRTPDLFAMLYVQTSGDIGGGSLMSTGAGGPDGDFAAPAFWNAAISPPFFRLKLDRLYISQFQSVSAAPSRDLALIFNYGLAATRTVVTVEGRNAGVPELATKFAVGGVRLSGARPGDYKSANLIALQSAWMPVPGVKDYDPRATVDVVAYVAEFTPGNPMLEDIGEYLAGQEVTQAVQDVITNELAPSDK